MKKLYLFVMLPLLFMSFGFAKTGITLSNAKSLYDIDEPITVKASISIDGNKELTIKEFQGMDNFKIISQTRSNSFYNMNGQISRQLLLNYVLKAKVKGDYELGPLVLQEGTGLIQSDVIKIKVQGDAIMIGAVTPSTNNAKPQQPMIENKDVDYTTGVTPIVIKKNYIGLLLGFIFVVVIIIVLIYKNKLKSSGNQMNEEAEIEIEIKQEQHPLDMSLPKITDNDFAIRIEKVLRNILFTYFEITNVKSKTFVELENELVQHEHGEILLLIKQLFKELDKARYSQVAIDKKGLLIKMNKLKKMLD